MAKAWILCVLICLAFSSGNGLPDRNLLTPTGILQIAARELGTREATGNNDGPRVEEYLAAAGLKKPAPYCAAFVSWVFKQAGYALPRTGWSPNLFPTARLVKDAAPGLVFGIYFPELKRIAHCGLVNKKHGDWIETLEGNTNVAGSRDGGGVYLRRRHKRTIRYYADWEKGNKRDGVP